MYSKDVACLQEIALREVFGDKQEKLRCFFAESCHQEDALLPASQFTQRSGSESGLSSFMSHCWVCLSAMPGTSFHGLLSGRGWACLWLV